MRKVTWLLCFLTLLAVANISIHRADAGDDEFLRKVEQLLKDTVKDKIREHVGDLSGNLSKNIAKSLISYDKQSQSIVFSPVFLRLAAYAVQERLSDFKKFSLEPTENKMAFSIEFLGGSRLAFGFVPQHLDLGVNEFSIVGMIPDGIQMEDAQSAKKALTGFLDSLLGIPANIGTLMEHITFDGDAIKLTRPYKASLLGRVLSRSGEGMTEPSSARVPFRMEDGRLILSLKDSLPEENLLKLVLDMLMDKYSYLVK